MHIAAIVSAVILFVAGYVYLFKSLNEQFEMQHEINSELPKEQQFEPVFWSFGTHERFRQFQKEFLSESPRPSRFQRFRITVAILWMSGLFSLWFALAR